MPLSEDEQRILGEIEANLRASDPDLAKQVGSTTVYTHSLRNLKWGVAGFVVSLVAAILLLSVSYLLAFGGFVAMVGAAAFIESNARKLGRVGINEATQAMRGGGLRGYFNGAGNRARDRLRRSDDES
jgi:hypothetical protein